MKHLLSMMVSYLVHLMTNDETKMTRELMKAFENNFRSKYMISDDVECFFNSDQFDKEGWLSGVSSHFDLFDNISNNKNQPINLTTANYNNYCFNGLV